MTRGALAHASRDDLIELVLDTAKERGRLDTRVQELERQLQSFKRPLFGRKAERRVLEPDRTQLALGEAMAPAADTEASVASGATTVREHARRKRPWKDPGEPPGLRFDDDVPVETIEIKDSEFARLPAHARAEIAEKVSYRLAQRPAQHVVLQIIRKVVNRRDTGALVCPPAPPSVLEGSYAEVSFLAGMLADKFIYRLPLYHQHQPLSASGIHRARATFTAWTSRAIDLLEPVCEA